MPGGAEIVRLLPFIIKLFPELAQSSILGKIIPLFKIDPATDEDLARELNKEVRIKQKNNSDATSVIKVSEAIKCAKSSFDNTTLISEFVLEAAKSLIAGRQIDACGQRMFDQMVNCMRQNSLRQDTPRVASRTTSHGRPARGHGHGRGKF